MTKTYTVADAIEDLKNSQIKARKNLFQKLKEGWKTAADYQMKHPEQFPHTTFSTTVF